MTHEEFIQKQKEAQEHFAKMTPEQQAAFKAAARRHHRKVKDEMETSFVVGVRKKLEANPDTVTEQEYQEYLKVLERDKEFTRSNKNSEQ